MPEIHIGEEKGALFARVLKSGTWENSLGFLTYCRQAIDDGARVLVIDLSECAYVDSTFCGTLVDLSCALQDVPNSVMKIYGIRGPVYETMQELGLARFFPVCYEGAPPFTIKTTPLPTQAKERAAQAEHVIRVHESLIGVDSGNEMRFSDCLKQMRTEIERSKEKPKGR